MHSPDTFKALLVDDSSGTIETTEAILSLLYIDCITASTDSKALEILQGPLRNDVGFVVTDQNMREDITGSRLLQLMRLSSETDGIPGGILTGDMMGSEDREEEDPSPISSSEKTPI